jgi:hypothetical protein
MHWKISMLWYQWFCKLTYRFSIILIKSPTGSSTYNLYIKILKFIWKNKKSRIGKKFWKRTNLGLTLSHFKTTKSYKKRVQWLYKDRHGSMDENKETRNRSHTYDQLLLWQSCQGISTERGQFSQQIVLGNWMDHHVEKCELQHVTHTI